MAIDFQRIYHTGVRVPDLQAAMTELGETMNLIWAAPNEIPEMPYWTPESGLVKTSLKYTYSCVGPQHVELLEGGDGSIWHCGNNPGVHHVGLWVDDVGAETKAAIDRGWTCAAASAPPEENYGRWTYVQPPNGMLVELVDTSIQQIFEPWWAEGLAKHRSS